MGLLTENRGIDKYTSIQGPNNIVRQKVFKEMCLRKYQIAKYLQFTEHKNKQTNDIVLQPKNSLPQVPCQFATISYILLMASRECCQIRLTARFILHEPCIHRKKCGKVN